MLAVVAGVSWSSCVDAAGQFRVVAETGQPSGISDSLFTNFIFGGAFDAANRVVIRGEAPHGTWVEHPTGLEPGINDGLQAPGFPPGALIDHLYKGSPVGPQGFSTIVGTVHGGPVSGFPQAAFVGEPGGEYRLASFTGKVIDEAAGIAVAGLLSSEQTITNFAGDALVRGGLQGGPLGATGVFATWIEGLDQSTIVAHQNTLAPGLSGGARFNNISSMEHAFDDSGLVALAGVASGTLGVWAIDPKTPANNRLVQRAGVDSTGTVTSDIGQLLMANGHIVFHASVADPGQGAKPAILADQGGVLERVVTVGQPAPGYASLSSFQSINRDLTTISRSGAISYLATVADPTLPRPGVGIWTDSADGPLSLALRLDALPGGAPQGPVRNLTTNDTGQLAFLALNPRPELWWSDAVLGPQLIAKIGSTVSVTLAGHPVSKTIEDVQVGGFLDSALGTARYLSDNGDVVFTARFTDGTSASLVWSPVPEPAAHALAGIFCAAATIASRRRRQRPARPTTS
jgi:hypothetical protein